MVTKLRKPIEVVAPEPEGGAESSVRPVPLTPLTIKGIIIDKPALLTVLRTYVNVVDLEVVEDGERFILTLAPVQEGSPDGRVSG